MFLHSFISSNWNCFWNKLVSENRDWDIDFLDYLRLPFGVQVHPSLWLDTKLVREIYVTFLLVVKLIDRSIDFSCSVNAFLDDLKKKIDCFSRKRNKFAHHEFPQIVTLLFPHVFKFFVRARVSGKKRRILEHYSSLCTSKPKDIQN